MSDTRDLTPLEEVMESVTNRARALEAVVAAARSAAGEYHEHGHYASLPLGTMQDLETALDELDKR